jgi:uncharacterized membrane protein YhaH (DUF805 family)
MSFTAWYVSHGRITRRTWWLLYTLPIAGLAILAMIADASLGYPVLSMTPADGVYYYTGGPVSTLIFLATIVPSISSTVTRLHDRGHSAWWLLWSLLPFVGWLVLFVQCGFLVGHGGANPYGPAPDDVNDPARAS